jgi:hypothetical protein
VVLSDPFNGRKKRPESRYFGFDRKAEAGYNTEVIPSQGFPLLSFSGSDSV